MHLKIGQLAKRTGMTVRALRHYDDIALLCPSIRSEGGYRLYDHADVARLYRIQALRRLGLPLAQIQRMLDDGGAGMPHLVARQIAQLGRQIEQAAALRDRLLALQAQLLVRSEPPIDDWLAALESMSVSDKYFTAEEVASLRDAASDGRAEEKTELAARIRALIALGASASSAEAGAIAQRWIDLLLDGVGGDEGLLMKLYLMHWNEPTLHALSGIDQRAMQFLSHAMAYRRLGMYARYCEPADLLRMRAAYIEHTGAWPPLICAVREQYSRGSAPDSEAMRTLAAQWRALSLAKAGGDAQLARKLQGAFRSEPLLRRGSGIDMPLMDYIGAAIGQLDSKPHEDPHARQ